MQMIGIAQDHVHPGVLEMSRRQSLDSPDRTHWHKAGRRYIPVGGMKNARSGPGARTGGQTRERKRRQRELKLLGIAYPSLLLVTCRHARPPLFST